MPKKGRICVFKNPVIIKHKKAETMKQTNTKILMYHHASVILRMILKRSAIKRHRSKKNFEKIKELAGSEFYLIVRNIHGENDVLAPYLRFSHLI